MNILCRLQLQYCAYIPNHIIFSPDGGTYRTSFHVQRTDGGREYASVWKSWTFDLSFFRGGIP